MAYPPFYDRQHNFADWQAEHPSDPLPADWLEEELNTAKSSIDGTIDSLKKIQRSDGALANKSVGFDQIKNELRVGVRQPYPWLSGRKYLVNDAVTFGTSFYACAVEHTSGSDFTNDLTAGRWTLVLDLEPLTGAAEAARDEAVAAADAAEAARASAEVLASGASTSASAAAASQTAAAGSASAAAASEIAAAASQAAALGSAGDAHAWADQAASGSVIMLSLTRADIASRTIPLLAFMVSGFSTPGDLGAGAVYVRGTSSGPMAIQDAAGTWWVLSIPDGITSIGHWGGIVGDSTATNAAISAAEAYLASVGGGILVFPSTGWSFTYSTPPATVARHFEGAVNRALLGGGGTANFRTAENVTLAGSHPTTRMAASGIVGYAVGSGANGVSFGDIAHEINLTKVNWSDPALAQAGEIDGQFIFLRQGGPTTGTKSAVGGQVIDVGATLGTGWCGAYEHVSSVFDPSNSLALTYQIDTQGAVLNSRDGDYYGWVQVAKVGTLNAVLNAITEGAARWTDLIRSKVVSIGAWNIFKLSDTGRITWNPNGDTGTTVILDPNSDGSLSVKKADLTKLFYVSQTGKVSIRSNQASERYRAISVGSGAPDGSVDGDPGDIFIRTETPTGSAIYIKYTTSGTLTGWYPISVRRTTTTALRPTGLNNSSDRGVTCWDTTIGKPIWWNGTAWVDATGAAV